MKKISFIFLLIFSTIAQAALTDADKSLIPGIALNSNPGAELSTSGWVTYHNGTTQPSTGMTGGSMSGNITFSRTTTVGEVIDRGNASFKIVKAAASAQGDGVSTTMTIAALPRSGLITMPIKIISGSVVQGDIKVFCWDNTNGGIIAPINNDVLGAGPITPSFPIAGNTTSLTCGVHFASTSTTAVTLTYKFLVNSQTAITGMGGSDWKSYTPTFSAGLGTPTNVNMFYRQVGDTLQIKGSFSAGTVAASIGTISLPPGLNIDTTKISPTALATSFGRGWRKSASQSNSMTSGPNDIDWAFAYNGTSNVVQIVRQIQSNGLYNNESMTSILQTGESVEVEPLNIPIAGWSSNVTMAQSSTFRISSYLANGTRVTSTPTALGQYRARYRATANVSTLTDVAPTTAPSSSNGMNIYGNVAWNAAGTSGQVGFYDIFIGKFKNFRIEWYQNTGFSGPFIANYYVDGTAEHGAVNAYDPSTGVLTVDATYIDNGANTSRTLGYVLPGSAATVSSGYFDVIVSENALAVGVQAPRSQVYLTGSSGVGTTNTHTSRFVTLVKNDGSEITYTDDAALGGYFKINSDGVYAINYDYYQNGNPGYAFVTLNGTQLSALGNAVTDGSEICVGYTGVNNIPTCATTLPLRAGDVIRAGTDNSVANSQYNAHFRITKVSN